MRKSKVYDVLTSARKMVHDLEKMADEVPSPIQVDIWCNSEAERLFRMLDSRGTVTEVDHMNDGKYIREIRDALLAAKTKGAEGLIHEPKSEVA